MLTFGELFAGAGGMALGLKRAGLKPGWAVDFNANATRSSIPRATVGAKLRGNGGAKRGNEYQTEANPTKDVAPIHHIHHSGPRNERSSARADSSSTSTRREPANSANKLRRLSRE